MSAPARAQNVRLAQEARLGEGSEQRGREEPMSSRIESIMTKAPRTVGLLQSLDVARDMMRAYDVRHLPVLDEGRLVGVVSEQSLQGPISMTRTRVEARMNPGPLTVAHDAAIADVARLMADLGLDAVLVTDEGRLVGIVTTVDLLRAYAALLDGRALERGASS